MEKIYSYELTVEDLSEMQKQLERIEYCLLSHDFEKFLGRKLRYYLKKIQSQKLTTINSKEDIKASNYMNSNHVKIEDGVIYVYNDAKIDISSSGMDEITKANYPAQLSLAKIVEYGIGYTGLVNSEGIEEDWEYDVNDHGPSGWYYMDDNGEIHWTNGFAGRYIFLELRNYTIEHIEEWINEYFKKMFK